MLQQYNSGYLCDDGTLVMIDDKTGIEDKIQLIAIPVIKSDPKSGMDKMIVCREK